MIHLLLLLISLWIFLTYSRPIVDGVNLFNEYFQAQTQGKALLLTYEAEAFIKPTDNDSKNTYFSPREICKKNII